MTPEQKSRVNIDALLVGSVAFYFCSQRHNLATSNHLADFMTYNLQSPLGQSQIDDRKT